MLTKINQTTGLRECVNEDAKSDLVHFLLKVIKESGFDVDLRQDNWTFSHSREAGLVFSISYQKPDYIYYRAEASYKGKSSFILFSGNERQISVANNVLLLIRNVYLWGGSQPPPS